LTPNHANNLAVHSHDTETHEPLSLQDHQSPELLLLKQYRTFFQHNAVELSYINSFRDEVKAILPYFEIFPSMITDILRLASTNQSLLHAILSVIHLILDSRLHQSSPLAVQHQRAALVFLQRKPISIYVTLISMAMLAWSNMSSHNHQTSNQYLHRLFQLFEEIQTQYQSESLLLKQIWRFSIRLDLVASILFFPRRPSFPPAPVNEDHLHRDWVRLSVHSDLNIEWVLASFALDKLMHRAVHIAIKAYDLRREQSDQCSLQIQTWIQSLLLEHAQWCTRSIILQAEDLEQTVIQRSPRQDEVEATFLDYPPLQIYNKFYSNLLNTWRAIYIFIDLIANPEIGPTTNPKRYSFAVDICRTYAALGKDDMFAIGKELAVFLTGVAFGGIRSNPREVGWLYNSMLNKFQENFPLGRSAVVLSVDVFG
jgi:hypothetical protein